MKSKKQTSKNNKQAISLIVLVITIIVMIILAGAIILTLNNNGIINKASEAVEKTNEATVNELAQTKWAEAYLTTDKSQEALEEYVLTELEKAGINIDEYSIKVTTNGVRVIKSVVATVDGVPIPKGFVASTATGENKKAKGLVIYEGTEAVTDANVEDARRSRNQYVWVPVDIATFDTTFVRKDYINTTSKISDTLGTSSMYWEVLPTIKLSTDNLKYMTEDTLTEVQEMYASVKKYGGFYIARYEAGIDTQRTAQGNAADLPGIKEGTKVYSVMGKIPYTYIPWTWNNALNEDTNGAVEVARRMYPDNDQNYGVVSTLTYGVQWDRAIQWFIDTEVMTENQVNKTEGSTAYGNYSDHVINSQDELNKGALVWDYTASSSGTYVEKYSTTLTYPKAIGTYWILSTGALKVANVNNIYDMAGNMNEWTMEGRSTESRTARGGTFVYIGTRTPVANRSYGGPDEAVSGNGFRPSLYIK